MDEHKENKNEKQNVFTIQDTILITN